MAARRIASTLLLLTLGLSGCSIGPTAIRLNMQRYNEAVAETESEQFLLNLVRLRYRDPPKTLAIGNVTSSFDVDATAPTVYSLGDKGNPFTVMAAQMHAADQPTISMAPVGGLDFTLGLVTPIPADRLALLASQGWDLDRLLRITVSNINGLENVMHLNGKGGETIPKFREFAAMAHTLGRLQHESKLALSLDPIPLAAGDLSEPLTFGGPRQAAEAKNEKPGKEGGSKDMVGNRPPLSPSDLLSAAKDKLIWHQVDANTIVLRKHHLVLDMFLVSDAWLDADLQLAARELKLTPGLAMYRILPPDAGLVQRSMQPEGGDMVMLTRSVLATLGYLSKGIDIPEKHIKEGLVAVPLDADGLPFDWTQVTQGLFHVCVSKVKPKHAFVAIKYRGFWYYIPDDDRESKSTFDLVLEAFNVQITQGIAQTPILTVPVGASSGSSGGGGGGGGGKRGG
jgi:hypothetical protein